MGGLGKTMKMTAWTFAIGALALAGIPPLSGFWSKDAILAEALARESGAVRRRHRGRVPDGALHVPPVLPRLRGQPEGGRQAHESPAVMTVPLIVLAVLAVVAGFVEMPFNGTGWFGEWLTGHAAEHARCGARHARLHGGRPSGHLSRLADLRERGHFARCRHVPRALADPSARAEILHRRNLSCGLHGLAARDRTGVSTPSTAMSSAAPSGWREARRSGQAARQPGCKAANCSPTACTSSSGWSFSLQRLPEGGFGDGKLFPLADAADVLADHRRCWCCSSYPVRTAARSARLRS